MIILSCGHEVDDFDHSHDVIVKTSDRAGGKALGYMVVCGPCEDRYRQHGELFDSEEQGYDWLKTEDW